MSRISRSRPVRYLRLLFGGLPRRARLTLEYQGWRSFLYRALTFPLRLTPLGRRLGLGARLDQRNQAVSWYRSRGVPVTVVIPSYGPAELAANAVASIRRTTDPKRVRVVVVDDGSAPEHQEALRAIAGAEVVVRAENRGFAATVNEGIALSDTDVVVMNSDVIAHEDWLELLQYRAYGGDEIGIAAPKLLYEDGTIQSAGSQRNAGAPEWFDHRYRFAPADHGPATAPAPVIAATGACLYVKRSLIDEIGTFEEGYGMGFEDVDWCLRAWEAGYQTIYAAESTLTHLESKTRGMEQGERELASQRLFWQRWGDWFDRREVRAPDGGLRIVYVTEDLGVGGGHRVVFEHLNGLADRGHHVELYTLEPGQPDWFDLRVPIRSFGHFEELVRALSAVEAIKVATWWNTSRFVWRAAVARGIPVYFVQDIETSYYPGNDRVQHAVLSSYRQEFRYLTTSGWNRERLAEMGLDATVVAPGVDLDRFRDRGLDREERTVVALGRTNPLKNFPLTVEAWRRLPEPRPELRLFGIEPELAREPRMTYVSAPSDDEVAELYGRATAFVQTSTHEGFCLPVLEAMATGAPVVCTDADGNRDFCRDGENCLMPASEPEAVAAALQRVLSDGALRARLSAGGLETAVRYGWSPLLDELERFYEGVAAGPGATPA